MVAAARSDPLTMSNFGLRLALLLVTVPVRAIAQPAAEPPADAAGPQQVSLHYIGEPECPSEAEFVAQVTARVRRQVHWSSAGAVVQMVVIVRHAGDHANGTLEVVQRATEPTRREFTAASCEEVGSALALVAALALDPNARTEQLPARAPAPAPSEPEPAAAPVPAPEVPPPAKPRPSPAPVSRPTRARNSYVVWLGPTFAAAAGYASEPLVALGLSLGARAVRPGFSPGFQLTPLWGKTGSTGPAATDGTFAWAIGRLEGCPVQVALAQPVRFEPCGVAEIGRLSARGAAADITPVGQERWWFAAGASLSLHLSLGSWFARLGAFTLLPATRDEFVFHDPERSIQQASWVVVGAALGLGFQFGS